MSYSQGPSGNSRGRGRGTYRGGGRSYRGGGRGGRGSSQFHGTLNPCKTFTTTGNCPKGSSCRFAHVLKLHAVVEASNYITDGQQSSSYNGGYHQQPQQYKAPVSAVALWESPAGLKIFTGSHDGFWRLWNTAGGNFVKEFEHNMRGKVNCVAVVNNFMFCGFETISRALPDVQVGMVHAWNLQEPGKPPLELQMSAMFPFAHNQAVTAIDIASEGGAKIVSGSKDGSIRVWAFQDGKFVLAKTLIGHAGEVTGLVLLPKNHLLWSCGMDQCIRIWDLKTGDCQYVITKETRAPIKPEQANPQHAAAAAGQQGELVGHTQAVTSLLSFHSPAGTFVLSSSLDGSIRAWNGTNGECVASESHGEGVITMSLAADAQGNQLLLIGLESGNIACRNLVQTAKAPAFQLLFTLSTKVSAAHQGAVKCLAAGPSATFYSGGNDGKMLVFQFTGPLGL